MVRAVTALIALVLVVRLVWGWWVGRQLQAQLDEIRQRGEPVAATDMVYPFVPDSENAWLLQLQAVQVIVKSGVESPSNSSLDCPNYLPYPAEWMKLAEASEKVHGQAFALARQARQLSRVQFRQGLTSPTISIILPYLNEAKQLANTIADGAEYSHLKGDDGEAMERLMDLLHLARSLRQDDFLVSQLVAIGIENIACNRMQMIGPGLRFDGTATTRPATRAMVRPLIDRLLEDGLIADGIRRSFLIERVMWIDYCRTASAGTWFIRPLADRNIIRVNRNMAIMQEASKCNNWPDAKDVLKRCKWDPPVGAAIFWGPTPAPSRTVPRYSRLFHGWAGDLSAYLERQFRVLAERRVTAVSLACQLYRADEGHWPHRLDELVPKYLPAAPKDPFYDDGRPLGYAVFKGGLPDGADRPMIFYNGEEKYLRPIAEPVYSWLSGGTQYRDVARFVPVKSTKAVDNNPQKSDAPREQPQDQQKPTQPEGK
ncbi:MAG: hypothetical protein NTU53_07100 [Planctomycetota bacterium]|nr:hypothetical protein [Planctomycetota bacterium]